MITGLSTVLHISSNTSGNASFLWYFPVSGRAACRSGHLAVYLHVKYMSTVQLTLDSLVSIECTSPADNRLRSLPPSVTADTTEAGLPVTIHRVSRADSIPSTECTAASNVSTISKDQVTIKYFNSCSKLKWNQNQLFRCYRTVSCWSSYRKAAGLLYGCRQHDFVYWRRQTIQCIQWCWVLWQWQSNTLSRHPSMVSNCT